MNDRALRIRLGLFVIGTAVLLGTLVVMFGSLPGGLQLLQTLFLDVKNALMHGLQEIFFWSAIIMGAAILLHVFLRRVPLRGRPSADDKAVQCMVSSAARRPATWASAASLKDGITPR